MDTTMMNVTASARHAATVIGKQFFESHRGAVRYGLGDTDETCCMLLYGNDGYAKREDSDPIIHARTIAYVHNLYVGLANLLPEGCVEFGTDEEGVSWAILAHFPWVEGRSGGDQASLNDDDDDQDDDDPLVDFWNDIVWNQWKSQLAFTEE
jgi:hypothetical protein